ncbi:unnamed protein product [Candida verbasci]|uniref:Calcium-channel protein CCH1 n=1 Tax=Candida verbasci TaxID=1227364 RepID=A0A9W4TUT8_9ASCO|nr:unnamed protein product [Candida verbasci]
MNNNYTSPFDDSQLYDEEYDPNKTYTSTSTSTNHQQQQQQSNRNPGNSLPKLHIITDELPKRNSYHSDKISIRSNNRLSVISHQSSSPRSLQSPNLQINTDDDLKEFKEGLNFALGSDNNEANWFPVSKKTSRSLSNENQENFTNEIPLQDMTSTQSPMKNLRSPFDDDVKSQISSPVHLHPQLTPYHLESGIIQQDENTSPTRIKDAISRISNRIAGTGRQNTDDDLSIIDTNSLKTPLHETNSFFDSHSLKSPIRSINQSIPDLTITDENEVTEGLGLSYDQEEKPEFEKPEFENLETMHLFGNSLRIFSPKSKIRQYCYKLLDSNFNDIFFLIVLILQVALLSYRQWNPSKLNGYFYTGYNWADYLLVIINIVYTIEIFAKMIAYGFYDDRIMFQDLGIAYPENELKKQYFSLSNIIKIFEYFGIKNFWKKEDPIYSDQNSSDEVDIKEINLNESVDNLLGKKYSEPIKSHHYSKSNIKPIGKTNTFFKPQIQKTFDTLKLKRAFMRHSWHRIDFISMVCFWISLLLSINHYDANHHIMLFRSLSCLRILRLCNLTTGTTTILTALKIAIPQLIDVSIFIGCFWLFFGIIGVQSFKSSLTRHCVWTNPNNPDESWINDDSYCGSFIGLQGQPMSYLDRQGNSTGVIKGYRCPMYSQCISGDNPYGGTVSFDNILQSLELVFVVMSANTFTDIMYYTMDSDNMTACLFFIGCIFVMTVWLLNVFIAVIVASFNITRLEVAEEQKKKKEGRKIFKLFGFSNEKVQLHEERIEFLKKQNIFLRLYYKFEFLLVIAVFVSLFVQCFRSYYMSETRRHVIYRFESGFTAVFLAEIIIRFLIHLPHWRLFFQSKRNIFDLFLAIITSIIILGPVKNRLGHAYYWLTVFQLMRFYRVVLSTSITRNLWLKIMGNFKAIFDLALFYFILLFLVSVILSRYFEGVVPESDLDDVDFPMNNLPASFIALYVITSTENWTDCLFHLQEYATTTSSRSFGSVFLIAWFILSNFIILNVFIAVIAKTLEVSEEGKRKQQLLQFIDIMSNKLQNIATESSLLSKIKKKLFKRNEVRDELEKAVINLLLSGTAVNDFLETERERIHIDDDESIRELHSSSWKRWFQINFWRTLNIFQNPFYDKVQNNHKVTLENFDPANFAQHIMKERKNMLNKQIQFLKDNPRYNYVFYIIAPQHPLRRLCQRLVKPSHGDRIDGVEPYKPVSEAVVVLMFLATIALVVLTCYMTPIYRLNYDGITWIFWSEYSFALVFTVEFAIKVLADGLIFTPNAYVRSSWNVIDLIVLISLWIEAIAYLKNDGNLSRIVRGLKALRALRLLTISETAKANFHNTMIAGFGKIINAAIISLCLLFPFSIWGLNIFNGRLGYCLDGESTMNECFNEYQNEVFNWDVVSPNVYTHPQLNFNKFSSSFASLFEIVSLEGWSDLLKNLMDSTGIGTVPSTNATPFNGFFIVLFNFISIVFILTLFVSVIISNYSKTTGRAYMTTDQISWYQVKKILVQVKPSKRKKPENLKMIKKFCYKMTVERNLIWNRILNIILFFHVVALLAECFPSSSGLNTFRTVIYEIASISFFLNAVMLLIGQGFKTFFHYRWNVFNFLISFGAFITTQISFKIEPNSPFFNFNKLFLVAILLFIIPRSDRLSQLLRFASASLPSLIALSFTWIIVFLVFAIAMNQFFGLTKIGPNGSNNINLRSVPKTLIVLFRCSFGEGWNYIMEDYTLSQPFCTIGDNIDRNDCGSKQYAYILFIAWNIISMYIFLNMFVSLILDSFDYINHKSSYSQLIQREELRKFKRTWQKFDPQGTGYIKPIELPKLLHSLQGSLSFHFYTGSLEIKELCKNWITRNSPNNPYDLTLHYEELDKILSQMDIPKIRERRKAYEMFIEEALLTMELNEDPGISFTRIILQLPLYTTFDTGKCFNLIDYLERRLLLQKVVKRLNTKRVYETIATYACRWKYKKDQNLGIRDDNIAFDSQLKRNSYLTNDKLLINQVPTIFLNEPEEEPKPSSSPSPPHNPFDDSMSSGVYFPNSPILHMKDKSKPKLSIDIPQDEITVDTVEEFIESSSWKDTFGDISKKDK